MGATALSAAIREEDCMSHHVKHHSHIEHNRDIAHDHEHGVAALTRKHHEELRAHGHILHSHHAEPHNVPDRSEQGGHED
jgi:hypothetical protein